MKKKYKRIARRRQGCGRISDGSDAGGVTRCVRVTCHWRATVVGVADGLRGVGDNADSGTWRNGDDSSDRSAERFGQCSTVFEEVDYTPRHRRMLERYWGTSKNTIFKRNNFHQ